MSPEPLEPDNPEKWMDFARTDFRMALEGEKNGYRLEPLCFHAQQAAEKALKAVLIARHVPFPKIHDLDKLLNLFPGDLMPPPRIREAKLLSDYSEAGRYPQGFEDVTLKDYHLAVGLSRAVVDWAEKILAADKPSQASEPQSPYNARRLMKSVRSAQPRKKRARG